MIILLKNIIDVPHEFTPKQLKPYPVDNEVPFEEWFYKNYQPERNESNRIYLPIQFTGFYCNNKHGRDRKSMNRLQLFINSLDRSKKYFSICQYDDNILNDVSHFDILKFGMGCKGDVQLPLVCQPHKYEFKETGRPIFASFIGSITHPLREQMVKELQGKDGYFISTEPTSLHSYCYIMSQSKYVICCRGYGASSFRQSECLQMGATPIYFSDQFLFNQGCFCVNSMDELLSFLERANRDNYLVRPEVNKETFRNFYTYESVQNMIYDALIKG